MVMPIYPALSIDNDDCYYSISVVKKSHTMSANQRRDQSFLRQNILHLELKVGQTFISHANLIHRGGSSWPGQDMFGTLDYKNSENTIPPIKNLSIHGYLVNTKGNNEIDHCATANETSFLKIN